MFSVIMAGGSGTRFWPLSRKDNPKQFLNITGRDPMVVETVNRLHPVSSDDETVLVVARTHVDKTRALFANRPVHILAEPVGRNTAPCIGLGALYAEYLGYNGPIAFLPADHFIADTDSFVKALKAAAELTEEAAIVTLGVVPVRPETGYGYIRRDQRSVKVGGISAYSVMEFVEKPDLERAMEYLSSGEYYWNAGIFVATASTILKEIKGCLPELHKGLMRLRPVMGTDRFETELREVYNEIKGISFDFGVMEKTDAEVYVVPLSCGWSDVGSWLSLYELRTGDHDEKGNLKEGDVVLIDCENSFISSQGKKLVSCLGLSDCLVVDTNDAVLVADINRSQDIRKIVDLLNATKPDLV
ncbi:MAG: mannose-1-phosphate guanylyltransferase [Deltaproteobacteria bacterium]|nr:mannose-1-phosphate guanylyltransferase [Deltaproteobacteria bacterium]